MSQHQPPKRVGNPENNKDKVNHERKMAFESLPPHVRENMTPEEVELFLYAKQWPEYMFKKFDEFILPQ